MVELTDLASPLPGVSNGWGKQDWGLFARTNQINTLKFLHRMTDFHDIALLAPVP